MTTVTVVQEKPVRIVELVRQSTEVTRLGRVGVQLPGVQGATGPQGESIKGDKGDKGDTGATGPAGQNFTLAGSVADYAALPALAAGDAGQVWLTNNDGRAYVWSGSAWPAEGTGAALRGPAGADGRNGQIRFTGYGPPPQVIVGAEPDDTYLDLLTGDTYKLV